MEYVKDMRRAERRRRSYLKFARRLQSSLDTCPLGNWALMDIGGWTNMDAGNMEQVIRLRFWRFNKAMSALKDTPTHFSHPLDSWELANEMIADLRRKEIPEEQETRYTHPRNRHPERSPYKNYLALGPHCFCGFYIKPCPNHPDRRPA